MTAWTIHFDETHLVIEKTNPAEFTTSTWTSGTKVPKGTLTLLSVQPRFTDQTGAKTRPVKPGDAAVKAELEFLAGIKGKGAKDFGDLISLGKAVGKMDYNTLTKPTPRFTVDDVKGPKVGPASSLSPDFKPDPDPRVERSDWVIRVVKETHQFVIQSAPSLLLRLPWLFDGTPTLLLTARLSIAGQIEAEAAFNKSVTIQLTHADVEEDLDANAKPLPLFGVRTVVPRALSHTKKFALGSNSFHVHFDPTVTAFIEGVATGASATVKSKVIEVLQALNLKPEVVMAGDPGFAASETTWAGLFVKTEVGKVDRFHARGISDVAKFVATGTIAAGEGVVVPFFRFFIALENVANSGKDEGVGESLIANLIDATAVTKKLAAPIRLGGDKITASLNKIDPADRANHIANVILHEIGHGLGLRHGVLAIDGPGYSSADADGLTMSLMFISTVISATRTQLHPCRLRFFGPVQTLALREAYSLP